MFRVALSHTKRCRAT